MNEKSLIFRFLDSIPLYAGQITFLLFVATYVGSEHFLFHPFLAPVTFAASCISQLILASLYFQLNNGKISLKDITIKVLIDIATYVITFATVSFLFSFLYALCFFVAGLACLGIMTYKAKVYKSLFIATVVPINLIFLGPLILSNNESNNDEIRSKLFSSQNFKLDFSEENCDFGKIWGKNAKEFTNNNFVPGIVCKIGDEKYISDFGEEWTGHKLIWSAAFLERKLAIFDYGAKENHAVLPVFRSDNAGTSWKPVGHIKKPEYSASLIKLSFQSLYEAEAIIEDISNNKDLVKSTNAGETWSEPHRLN